jgi:hypothetical protein
VGFEPTIAALELAKTVHALDCAASVTGSYDVLVTYIFMRFVVLTEASIQIMDFCDATPCNLAVKYQIFGIIFCFRFSLRRWTLAVSSTEHGGK